MSKIKDYLGQGGILGRIAAFLALFVWVVNLIGGTAYHFWASKTLVANGIIDSGFGLFGVLNIIVSCLAVPVLIKAWKLLDSQKKEGE